jgi:putative ABC transport system permease protein
MMDIVLRDLRHALRALRRERFVAALTILTLGVGIGVLTALFAIVSAVLLRPIVPDQDRVVIVSKLDPQRGSFPVPLSLPEFAAWREQTRSFDVLSAVNHAATGTVPLAIDGQVVPARVAPVSADFFAVVHGGEPLHGRWFRPADEQIGSDVVAVVSERFWRRIGGGDPAFIGRRLSLAGDRTLVIVGIAPATVDYPLGTDMWAPAAAVFDGRAGRFDASNRTFFQFEIVGRLRRGVSLEQVRAELTVIHRRVAEMFPKEFNPTTVAVEPLIDSVAGESRRVLLVLLAAAGLVFVISGVNVAALLLMRASARRSEMAVRVALGAGYGRLLRQTLTEGLVLALLSATWALLVARALLAVLLWLAPGDVPRIELATIDVRVLMFCAGAALAWALTLGTVPAWATRRLARAPGVERAFRGVRGTTGLLMFTVAEISAAVVVAIGAGLLLRSFAHLQSIERGFSSNNLVMASLLIPEARQRDPRSMLAFYDQLLPRVAALPGVITATPTHVGPGSGTFGLSAPMFFEGQTPEESQSNPFSTWEPVLPSYFRTFGIPILRGRAFTGTDRRDRAPVAIVSESVAARYWPGQDPIGRRLQFVHSTSTSEWPWVTVVGVAADTRYRELTKSWMTVYFPADQFFFFQAASLVVRASSSAEALAPALREAVRAIEPGATVASIAPMDALLARELARPLTAMTVSGVFALIAIALAAVGVYGVMSYEVGQRRREIAVRCAIGATSATIFQTVLRRSFLVGLAGGGIGLALAGAVTRTLASLLYGIEPGDAEVFLIGAGVLLVVVVAAASVPAYRAAHVDPVDALRAE